MVPQASTHSTTKVTVTAPDGSETTTETRVVETTRTSRGGAGGAGGATSVHDAHAADESGAHAASGYSVHVDEIPPVEQVVLDAVLEGVGIVQKGAEYVRKVSAVASMLFGKKGQ